MTITIKFGEDAKRIGRQFKFGTQRFGERSIAAAQGAARQCSNSIIQRGREDIKAGGNFGSARWQQGLQAKVSFQSRSDIVIRIVHAVFYWKVFEYGAVIKGRPLLWIPLDFASDAKGVMARDYPGQLFRVDRKGKAPLLMSPDGSAKYFGKESVKIPKKFHLRAICQDEATKLPVYYKQLMSQAR